MQTAHGCVVQNNRSKSACTLNARKRLNNQAVWPVIFDLTGPICARAPESLHPLELRPRGHHDWPVKSAYRKRDCKFPGSRFGIESSPCSTCLQKQKLPAKSRQMFRNSAFLYTAAFSTTYFF